MAQVKGGPANFQDTAVKIKYLGYMADLENAEVATAAIAKETLKYLLWELVSEEDSTTQANSKL